MKPWKTLSRVPVYHHSKWLTVENHSIELPDGRVLDEWPWVISPEYVNVVPVMADGRVMCFRQTKYAVPGVSLAPIGGYLDGNEDPLAAAKRELREETGCEAASWQSLGHFAVDGNHGAGKAHLFLALDTRKTGDPNADDLEEQQLVMLTRKEIAEALAAGDFKVLSWSAALALALLRLEDLPGGNR